MTLEVNEFTPVYSSYFLVRRRCVNWLLNNDSTLFS